MFYPSIVLPGALDVLHGDVHLENQVKVHVVVGDLRRVGGAGDSKWLLSANIDKVHDSGFQFVGVCHNHFRSILLWILGGNSGEI